MFLHEFYTDDTVENKVTFGDAMWRVFLFKERKERKFCQGKTYQGWVGI